AKIPAGAALRTNRRIAGAPCDATALPNYGKSRYPAMAADLIVAARGIMDLKQHIRAIPDFPKPGILFYDISTLLAHPRAWHATVERRAEAVRPHRPDLLIGIESRGFLVAAPLAYILGSGLAIVRKKGQVPGKTVRYPYEL